MGCALYCSSWNTGCEHTRCTHMTVVPSDIINIIIVLSREQNFKRLLMTFWLSMSLTLLECVQVNVRRCSSTKRCFYWTASRPAVCHLQPERPGSPPDQSKQAPDGGIRMQKGVHSTNVCKRRHSVPYNSKGLFMNPCTPNVHALQPRPHPSNHLSCFR